VQRHTLGNRLQVLVVDKHSAPLVTIEVAVWGAAMAESLALSGVSHLQKHMFFRASKALPTPEAFRARWRELGIEGNANSGVERVS
jgi:predicted Zn-dependent peptidase